MILCLGTTPAVQRVMRFSRFQLDHVNRAAETLEGGGGKFINVAKALQCLGESSFALGFAGGDRGAFLAQVLRQHGVRFELLPVDSRTRLCTTVLDDAGKTVTELVEESPSVTGADCDRLIQALKRHLPAARALVLSGTIAPGGPDDLYYRSAALAHEAGVITIVDAQGAALLEALKAAPALAKPNRAELEKTFGKKMESENAIFDAMNELAHLGAERVVVTRGAEPALALDKGARWRVTSPRIAPVNPIGSGDCFTAALTAALSSGLSLGEACKHGAAAGAANALSLMPGIFERADFERCLASVKLEGLPG
jgi:tagatose 6-phosphate kinase